MARLTDIVQTLNDELKIDEIPDYGQALNGLQLENGGEVMRVAAAVDATFPVIQKAVEQGADLLIVHHGLFWQGAECINGVFYKKLKLAMDAGLAIYSAHIPLDVHPKLGNTAILAEKIANTQWSPFFDWKGINLGLKAELEMSVGELAQRVSNATDDKLLLLPRDSEKRAGMTAVITGGAGSEVKTMADLGIQTFISGEAPHWAHGLAEERDLELILGGHYATETFGVKALQNWLETAFELTGCFIDHPSGL